MLTQINGHSLRVAQNISGAIPTMQRNTKMSTLGEIIVLACSGVIPFPNRNRINVGCACAPSATGAQAHPTGLLLFVTKIEITSKEQI